MPSGDTCHNDSFRKLQQGEVVELLCMWGSNWNALSSAWGWMQNESRVYGLELRDRLIWVTLLWVFTIGHLTRKRKSMRPCTDSWKQFHCQRPWFSCETLTTLTSAGKTTKHTQSRRFLQSTDDNFFTQMEEEPKRRGVLLDLVLTNTSGWGCEGWGQLWHQWPWDGGIQDPLWRKHGKK